MQGVDTELRRALAVFFCLPNWENRIGPYTDIRRALEDVRDYFFTSGGLPSEEAATTEAVVPIATTTGTGGLNVLRKYISTTMSSEPRFSDKEASALTSFQAGRYSALEEVLRVVNLIASNPPANKGWSGID